VRCGSAAKIGMMCWSLTRDRGRCGNGSRIRMLNIEADAHSVVIQLVVAHISILWYGMEVRNPGKPSSSHRVSTELPNSSPVWDYRDVSSQKVSRCESSWLYQGCIRPLPPKSVGSYMMAWGKLHGYPPFGRQILKIGDMRSSQCSLESVVAAMGYSRVFISVVVSTCHMSFFSVFRDDLMADTNSSILLSRYADSPVIVLVPSSFLNHPSIDPSGAVIGHRSQNWLASAFLGDNGWYFPRVN